MLDGKRWHVFKLAFLCLLQIPLSIVGLAFLPKQKMLAYLIFSKLGLMFVWAKVVEMAILLIESALISIFILFL